MRYKSDLLLLRRSLTLFFLLCFSVILSSFRKPSLCSWLPAFFSCGVPRLRHCLIRSSTTLNVVTTCTIDQTLMWFLGEPKNQMQWNTFATRYYCKKVLNSPDVHTIDFEVCTDTKFSTIGYHLNCLMEMDSVFYFKWLRLQIS